MPTIVSPQPTRPRALARLPMPPYSIHLSSTLDTTRPSSPPKLGSPIDLREVETTGRHSLWSPRSLELTSRRRLPRRQLFGPCTRASCCSTDCPITTPSLHMDRSTANFDLVDGYMLGDMLGDLPATLGPIRRRKGALRPNPFQSYSKSTVSPITLIDASSCHNARPVTPPRWSAPNSQIQFRNLMPLLIPDSLSNDLHGPTRPPETEISQS